MDKGRLSLPQPLIDAPFRYKHSSCCSRRLGVSGPPLPENQWRIFSFDFLLKFALKTAIFGRSLAQLVLATLLLYPFGVKEAQKGVSLLIYPLVGFAYLRTLLDFGLLAPHGLYSGLLGLHGLDSGLLWLFGAC